MNEPIKIRARMKGDSAEIRLLIPHPMESGQRKNASGQLIPARFIQTLTVDVAGRRVVDAQLSGSVSRDPYFVFRVEKVGAGDTVTVRWQDNTGETGEGSAPIL
ncbi:MAG: thiosulfate oxidation carrier complex protein SoxZ [Betaproteobacteria bacterium HGW-Betaproteobacteria-11]|nr:MAG: thiosulfate oxidation carrier complex protein SoxZ [Betaproteobacteria bacterium HGW-Betaproteobacteria-11]